MQLEKKNVIQNLIEYQRRLLTQTKQLNFLKKNSHQLTAAINVKLVMNYKNLECKTTRFLSSYNEKKISFQHLECNLWLQKKQFHGNLINFCSLSQRGLESPGKIQDRFSIFSCLNLFKNILKHMRAQEPSFSGVANDGLLYFLARNVSC